MVKKHEVIDLISHALQDAVDPAVIVMVDMSKVDNYLEVTFTEKDLTESTYEITVEMIR